MKKLWLTGLALIVAGALAYTPALTQEAKEAKPAATKKVASKGAPSRSVAARTALCKADCRPNNLKASGIGIHGHYRSYNSFDPHLTSLEGRKQFAECVKNCVAPLPRIYIQRPLLEGGGSWFGKDAASCLSCHAKGPNLRVPGEK